MGAPKTIQLGEICRRLDVRERDARYVLEQGHVPRGVDEAPASGNYRQFGPGPAFWLGMVLKLKAAGVQGPLAVEVADYADQALRGITQNLSWDWAFSPAQGKFDTEHRYFLDVGDRQFVRVVTDAGPSSGGRLEEFDWHPIEKLRKPAESCRPWVVMRLDLTKIAEQLADAF
ncbi:MAG: hypothetical protein WD894_22290 [Pirellulales bacterium]